MQMENQERGGKEHKKEKKETTWKTRAKETSLESTSLPGTTRVPPISQQTAIRQSVDSYPRDTQPPTDNETGYVMDSLKH